jgi:hypothetical protein
MLKRVAPVLAGLALVASWSSPYRRRPAIRRMCSARRRGPNRTAATRRICPGRARRSPSAPASRLTAATTTRTRSSRARAARRRRPASCRLAAKHGPFNTEAAFNSDLAFEDGYAYQGNYEGVTIYDISDPSNPTVAGQIACPGSQNDVSINDGILITSTDSRRTQRSLRTAPRPPRRPIPALGRA